eukprot:5488150-Pyramimonas_sp.AAC.1
MMLVEGNGEGRPSFTRPKWAGASREDVLTATRAALPLETVWARGSGGGAVELRTVAFPRWNAADLQQTECKAVQ